MVTMNGTLPRWQLTFPTRHVLRAELVALLTVLVLARHAWWIGLLTVLPVLLAAGLHYRGATLPRWAARATHRHPALAPIPPAVTVELPGSGPIGLRMDGPYAITVINLHGQPFPATLLIPTGADTTDTVPLEAIGGLLRQFGDLELHSIDVVSAGHRLADTGRYTPRYDEIIGDLPAVGARRTWLVLRLCPQACLKALAYRGDVGVAVAAATERIRQAAVTAGCRATTCSPDQLDATTTDLLGGHTPDQLHQQWTHLRAGNEYLTSYRIAGDDLTSRLLSDVWTIRARTAVTVLRLTHNDGGDVQVAALVRLHTTSPLTHPPMALLHPLPGQQTTAVYASLPLGNRALTLPLSARTVKADGRHRHTPRTALQVPVGPSGTMLGKSRRDGVPLLIPLTDPLKYAKVAIDADFPVAAALLLRATAAGATAVIHTDRPQLWAPLCDDRIHLAEDGDGVQKLNTPTLLVADGDNAARRWEASSGERGHTLVITGQPTVPKDFDMIIREQHGTDLDVRMRDGRYFILAIRRPRNEMQFLQAASIQ